MPQSKAKLKEKREARRKAGLCTACGKNPPEDKDSALCSTCRGYYRKWRKKHEVAGNCKRCGKVPEPGKKTCSECLRKQREYVRGLRDAAFEAYGGYKCKCCGEKHREFLQLDHVNNDGNEHRKEVGSAGGDRLYLWLRNHGYPPIMQVLCANCNYAKAHYGFCPHRPNREVNDAPLRRSG